MNLVTIPYIYFNNPKISKTKINNIVILNNYFRNRIIYKTSNIYNERKIMPLLNLELAQSNANNVKDLGAKECTEIHI